MISPTGKAEVVLWKSGCSDSTQEKTYPILSQGPWSDIYEDFIHHKKAKYLCKNENEQVTSYNYSTKQEKFWYFEKHSGKCKKGIFYSCLLCNPWISASWQFCLVMSVRFIVGPLPASDTDQDPLPQKIQKRGTLVVYSTLPPYRYQSWPIFWISTLNDSVPPSLVTKLERGRQLQS